MSARGRLWTKAVLLALGLGAFAWYLHRAGLREVGAALARLGWAAPLVLLPYLGVYIVDALGWRLTFTGPLPVGFLTLLRIRWAGESVNNVIPSAYVGGEALKVFLLSKRGVDPGLATGAAVVSKSAQTLAQVLFISVAAAVFLRIAPDVPWLRRALAFVLAGGIAAVGVLFWIQLRGMFGTLRRMTGWLGWKPAWLEARRTAMEATDAIIADFYRLRRGRFAASTLAYLGGWLGDTLEIWLVGHLLGQAISWPQAFVVEAFVGVAKAMGMWVPGAIGVQEGGILLVGRAAGLPDPFLLAYAVLRRAREVVFVAIGYAWLTLARR